MRPHPLAPAVLILSSFSVCAVAQQTEYATVVAEADVPAKMVSYGDLNLQRHEGVAKLYQRIQSAANIVCSQVNQPSLQVALRARNCASDATSRAVALVGVPALSTLHAQRIEKETRTTVAMAGGSQ